MTKKQLPKKKTDSYLKYSGLAFQMAGIIMISIFAGKWLDGQMQNEKPYMTMLLMLLFFGAFMYKLTKDLNK